MKKWVRIQEEVLYRVLIAKYVTHLNSTLDLGLNRKKRRVVFAKIARPVWVGRAWAGLRPPWLGRCGVPGLLTPCPPRLAH